MGERPKRGLGVPEPQTPFTAGELRGEMVRPSSGCSLLVLSVRLLGLAAAVLSSQEGGVRITGLTWPGSEESNLTPDVRRLGGCGHESGAVSWWGDLPSNFGGFSPTNDLFEVV